MVSLSAKYLSSLDRFPFPQSIFSSNKKPFLKPYTAESFFLACYHSRWLHVTDRTMKVWQKVLTFKLMFPCFTESKLKLWIKLNFVSDFQNTIAIWFPQQLICLVFTNMHDISKLFWIDQLSVPSKDFLKHDTKPLILGDWPAEIAQTFNVS